ncbi:MAG TPA: acetamidase/formamidase family protein [Ktedonobacteraceae bacterium]|nr:acetamidase/formamidase family protein [Ktedonobacteraceae bacterium]
MATYHIEPERTTLHGSFSREYSPVLTIDSGDTVLFRTLNSAWALEPPLFQQGKVKKFEPRLPEQDDGHALCGPIAIRGARPGMILEVSINEVIPHRWGWTGAGGRDTELNRRLGLVEQGVELIWELDASSMTGKDQFGHTLALRPFMGVMGMPPDEPGIHSTIPPRFCGGNIDCKELLAGSTLYLPIAVPLGLFSVGDGHAVQGDGEVSGVAIECPMERVNLTFHLRDDMHLTTPRAMTPDAWITLGFHEDLHEASLIALDAMLDLMGELYQLPREQALALASLVVDLRVTQIANGVFGIHAILSRETKLSEATR